MEPLAARPERYRFGPYRLDVGERTLLRGHEPVPLRAKLFDTLVVLLRSPGRLVTRAELLEQVWPDSIVEEGNLSHNVSALRKALRDGEGERYIETVPRSGYRFVQAVEEAPEEPRSAGGAGGASGALERARRFLAEGAWERAHRAFLEAAAEAPLAGDDAAGLAETARWSGRFEEQVPLLEAAAEAYRREGDALGAARTAIELARVLLDRRRVALAASYARQAERSLPPRTEPGPDPATRERARLAHLQGRLRWAESDWEGALEHARSASELARACGERGTEAAALMCSGHSLLALGRYDEAAEALEESGGVATGGELAPEAASETLCGLIIGWRSCGRWDRAAEWVEVSARWADGSGVSFFPGLCRVHRGELMCLRGDLALAEEDLERGTEELLRADSALVGPGLRELGTVRLRRGDLPGAEEAFARALEFGIDPQPGLARLRAERGQGDQACGDLERFLSDQGASSRSLLDREHRFEALEAYAQLALSTGRVDQARGAVDELERIAAATGSAYHRAAADGAAGELALAGGDTPEALSLLRSSWRAWTGIPAPYEAARAREQLGLALLADGDRGRAQMELQGALGTFARLGAELDRRRLAARQAQLELPGTGPRVVVQGHVDDAEALRSVLGDEAWNDLSAWLRRTLTGCWSAHGGRALETAAGDHVVAFDELGSALRCVAFVQRSLREHRARHGFAPRLRVAVADASALGGEAGLDALQALARELSRERADEPVSLGADSEVARGSAALRDLRAEGVGVRVVAPEQRRAPEA